MLQPTASMAEKERKVARSIGVHPFINFSMGSTVDESSSCSGKEGKEEEKEEKGLPLTPMRSSVSI